MKQVQFVAENEALWAQIATMLEDKNADRRALPAAYRRLCQCLALARQRGYSPAIAEYLQNMVSQCHRELYGAGVARPTTLLRWMLVDFPCTVRAEWRLLLLASIALYVVALVVGLMVWFEPHWAYSFSSAEKLESYRKMYMPGAMDAGRGSEGDVQMFGHYIWNNVSIGFRSFAGGIFGGVPALYSLTLNGIHTGVLAAWLSKDPLTRHHFWSFVITHSSFEITGLLLSAVAGMRLGLTVIHPGRRSRGHALQVASRAIFPVMVGGGLMTFGAAFVEAFWSASTVVPQNVKYGVGALCWALVIGFFVFAGRRRQ
ncbi:MAG TPA: stage II sporulation protein M [Telluria sp.]|jgi:uncharacterized membrane protein SpoIIM required for sporulation